MTPYYDHAGITIFHGDCREILPTLPKVDLALTDPPYGISDAPIRGQGRTGRRSGGVNVWHPISEWDSELILPDIKADIIAWWGHWRKREEVSAKYGRPRCEIIWAKDCHVGPPCPAAMRDERLWVFSDDAFEPRRFIWLTLINLIVLMGYLIAKSSDAKTLQLVCLIVFISLTIGKVILFGLAMRGEA